MRTFSLKDLAKTKKLNHGLPEQEERVKFREEVVLGQDGIYRSYLSDFFDIVYKTESFKGETGELLSNLGIPEVEPRLTLAEKIPSENIYKMVAWYRHVNDKYGTEATMQVFYDKTEGEKDFPQELKDKYQGAIKRDGKFVYVIPVQEVTGGFVSFDGDSFPATLDRELYQWALENYEPILNIHSHNSMSAFWSTTDDANELPLYTRLCLVVGRVHTEKPEFRFSWNFEGKRHHQESNIDMFIEPLQIKTTTSVEGMGISYESTEEKGFDESLAYLDFDKVEFDERWDNMIYAQGSKGFRKGQYLKLDELDKDEYTVTEEELEKIEKLEGSGVSLQGLDLDKEELDELYEEMAQNGFYDDSDDSEDSDEDSDEDYDEDGFHGGDTSYGGVNTEGWKRDLLYFKDKVLEKNTKEDSNISGNVGGFQKPFRNFQQQGKEVIKKGTSAYDRYKRDQMRNKEGFNDTDSTGDKYEQSSILDDVER